MQTQGKVAWKPLCMAAIFLATTLSAGTVVCSQPSGETAARVQMRVNQIMKQKNIPMERLPMQVRHEVRTLSNEELAGLVRELSVGPILLEQAGPPKGHVVGNRERVDMKTPHARNFPSGVNVANAPASTPCQVKKAKKSQGRNDLKIMMSDPRTRNRVEAMVTNYFLNNL